MSLLEQLHRRIDHLNSDQQRNLKRWLDYQDKVGNQSSCELTDFAQSAINHAARTWGDDDWSSEYAAWKKLKESDNASG